MTRELNYAWLIQFMAREYGYTPKEIGDLSSVQVIALMTKQDKYRHAINYTGESVTKKYDAERNKLYKILESKGMTKEDINKLSWAEARRLANG